MIDENTLDNIINVDNPNGTISLDLFSKVFFPMFLAYLSGKQNVDLSYWYDETNTNGYQSVDVVDRAGEIVFTVPPLLNNRKTDLGDTLEMSPAEIMAIADMHDKSFPGNGVKYIEKNLTEKFDRDVEGNLQLQEKFVNGWKKIFKFYGYESDGTGDTNGSASEEDIEEDGWSDF